MNYPLRSSVIRCVLLAFALLSLTASPRVSAAAQDVPTKDELKANADRCEKILKGSLIDFYNPGCLDRENGGYLENLEGNRFVPRGEKFLVYQARQLWFFSTLAREGIDHERSLEAAKIGFGFLRDKMRDPIHGGFFAKVTDRGEPQDDRKHAYLNSFALYGIAAYARATGDPRAKDLARELFEVFETKFRDTRHGGYHEFFSRDWKPITDASKGGYVGATGQKTFNTHLHIMEAFTELYRLWPDERIGQRLQELLLINTSTLRYPGADCNVDAFHPDWRIVETPQNLRASYGHDVECVWLVMDTAEALGMSTALLRNWGESLCRYSIRFGFDSEHGGFFASGRIGEPADDTTKIWWVQAEALVAMLSLFQQTGNNDYYRHFAKTFDFVEKYQVAPEGDWWSNLRKDGTPKDRSRANQWHAAYHAGRSMLLCGKLLRQLAESPQQ